MLDQITFTDTVLLHISQQLLHAVELMVTRPDLFDGLLLGILVHLFDDLRVIFYNARQFSLGKDILPKVVCHKTVRIRRISRAIVIAFIERQEPAIFPGKFRTELNRGIIHSKMNHATLEGEQQIMKISVFLILAHSVFCILLCKLVLQLHCDNREAVDEQANIQSQFSCILRIAQLPCHAEDVLLIHDSGLLVIFGRCQIEHDEICRINLHAIAQYINDASLSDLSGQTVQELSLLCIRSEHTQLVHFLWLSILQEPEQARLVDSIFFVIVGVCSFFVPVLFNQPLHD